MFCRSLSFLLLSLCPALLFSQTLSPIEEIVVTAVQAEDRVAPSSIVLDYEELAELQPVGTADVFRNLTGVSLRTNSRGESVVRVRGSAERQTLIFLDGTPLATPWDGRADLALLPAGLIDQVSVSRGVVPIEYGANAVAGAVDLTTVVAPPGPMFRAEAQQGTLGLQNASAIGGAGLANGWSVLGGIARIARDAERIADRSSIRFDPATGSSRTNTDLEGHSFFASAGFADDTVNVRGSVLHADVERGVAAQSDLDPATSNPRFWRTPQWRMTQAMLNGQWNTSDRTVVRVAAWRQWFDQTIDAYTDYSYSALRDRDEGVDDTVGVRATMSLEWQRATLRMVATHQDSTHRQIEFATATGEAEDFVASPTLRYRQRLQTLGAELDVPISDVLTSTWGLAVDRASTPLTGDKPAQPSLSATGWSAGLRWQATPRLEVSASAGERSRFATPRELYGAALGRFLLNPELAPERSLLSDLGATYVPNDALTLNVAVWMNRSDDTLSQRAVIVDGISRRQRYNTNGSFTYGIESAITSHLTDNLRAELSVALQDGDAEVDADGTRPPLLQRPKSQLRAALDWQATAAVDLRIEMMYTGASFDLNDDGESVALPSATSVNLRGFVRIAEWLGRDVHLTASIDNATNALILPQLGLPAPGRAMRIGIRIN